MVPKPASSTPRGICFRSVRPATPSLIRFAPASALSTPRARYLIHIPRSRSRIGSPLPFRGLSSLPDQRGSTRCVARKLVFRNIPISHMLPVVGLLINIPISDLRSGSANASEARRSSNLLEPIQFSSRRYPKSIRFYTPKLRNSRRTARASSARHVHPYIAVSRRW